MPNRVLLSILAVLVAVSAVPASSKPTGVLAAPQLPATGWNSPPPQTDDEAEVIVVLEDGEDPLSVAREMGVKVTHIYRHVFVGFAGTMDVETVSEARAAGAVQRIFEDGPVQAEAQIIPTGIRRINVPLDPDGDQVAIPSPVDADIAILDTGVARIADLTVAGGYSCLHAAREDKKEEKREKKRKHGKGKRGDRDSKRDRRHDRRDHRQNSRPGRWLDDNGHGTHTAGIAAAIDNEQGVVGVAPGARVWAVKVLDSQGRGSISDVICGLDWVVKRKATIDVVNLSLSGPGRDGRCRDTAFHRAVCATDAAGIPIVAAAGNQGTDGSTRVPASFDEVITVSAFGDSDGQVGGTGPPTCSGRPDDSFLDFSNFGEDVDIAAPGDCILSLLPDGDLQEFSGTSEATPHVTGAVANFVASSLGAQGSRPTPAETREWLLSVASRPQDSAEGFTGGPSASHEPVLWLESLDILP